MELVLNRYKIFTIAELERTNKELELIASKAKNVAFMNEMKQYKNRRMYQCEYNRIRNELENNTVPFQSREGIKQRVAHLEKLGLTATDNNKYSGINIF